MKKIRQILSLAAVSFAAISCSGSKVEFDYVRLVNNDTGFSASDGDTAIAIGLKKGSSLKAGIDAYLSTLNQDNWTDLMSKMVALSAENSTATYDASNLNNDTSAGTFKVGMECGYIPYNWSQTNDKNGAVPIANNKGNYANGYDVQIARQVANALNMKLEVYQYEWDALLPAVQSGAIDGIVAGMSPTEERLKEIDFSAIYYRSNLVVVTRKNSKLMECKNLSELDQKGFKIAAQPGTFHLDALKAQTQNVTVIENLEDFVDMQIALQAGTIDGYVAEEPTALSFCN